MVPWPSMIGTKRVPRVTGNRIMPRTRPNIPSDDNHPSGFTLIELLVTITIAAILISLAVPSYSNLVAATRAKTTANDFFMAMQKARSEAIKRNQNITLTLTADASDCGGTGTWRFRIESPETVYCTRKGLTVAGPASIVYQSSGRLQGTATASYQLTASAPTTVYRCVVIDPSGRPFVKAVAC